jgi:ubiquinol-cytochrome c reductase cytochrome c subunit
VPEVTRRILLATLAGILAALLGVVLIVPAGASDGMGRATPLDAGLIHRGASLYAANCSQCHGVTGAGKLRPGPASGVRNVAGIGPSLRGVGALAADFYLSTGYMPLLSPYDQPRRSRVLFSAHDVRALVAYVASLAPGPGVPHPDPARGSVSQGMSLFAENCAGCHQIGAAGGYVPDSVAPPLGADSPRQIAEAVRIGPNLMPRFSQSLLSNHGLDSVIAYVQYANAPYDRGGWSLGHVGPVPEGLVAWFVAAVVLVGVSLTVGRRLA